MKMKPELFFVFDVESIGLHGEAFAVAWVVVDREGKRVASASYWCDPALAEGTDEDREWAKVNVTVSGQQLDTPSSLRNHFWDAIIECKKRGTTVWADCNWPVETNFMSACIAAAPYRAEDAPYPFMDIAAVLWAAGLDPTAHYGRLENELPAHNALNDARQSARILIETLNELKR